MTVNIFSLLGTLVMTSAAAFAQSPIQDCPPSNGAFFLQGSSWTPIEPSHSMGFKTTNVAGAAFSYGAAKAKVKAQFRDGSSPYQLGANTLTVCLVGVTDSGRDITLAKFQEEKNRRELVMGSYRMWTGVNAQIDPKSLIPISIDKKGDKLYVVTSKEPLPTGEFILFTTVPDVAAMMKSTASLGGYDFGSHAK